jgi:hypothetical protein
MIACGEDIGAQIEYVVGDLRGDAEAAGGVLDIDDHEFDCVRLADVAYVRLNDPAPSTAENIADEEEIQKATPSY